MDGRRGFLGGSKSCRITLTTGFGNSRSSASLLVHSLGGFSQDFPLSGFSGFFFRLGIVRLLDPESHRMRSFTNETYPISEMTEGWSDPVVKFGSAHRADDRLLHGPQSIMPLVLQVSTDLRSARFASDGDTSQIRRLNYYLTLTSHLGVLP